MCVVSISSLHVTIFVYVHMLLQMSVELLRCLPRLANATLGTSPYERYFAIYMINLLGWPETRLAQVTLS